jgi:hypothetical protein
MDIFIQYFPTKEGLQKEKIILACDNQTSATYNLIGKGNMAELAIFGIDDYVIEKNLSKED